MLNQFYVLLVFKLKLRQQHTERRVLQAFLRIETVSNFVNIIRNRFLLIWIVIICIWW